VAKATAALPPSAPILLAPSVTEDRDRTDRRKEGRGPPGRGDVDAHMLDNGHYHALGQPHQPGPTPSASQPTYAAAAVGVHVCPCRRLFRRLAPRLGRPRSAPSARNSEGSGHHPCGLLSREPARARGAQCRAGRPGYPRCRRLLPAGARRRLAQSGGQRQIGGWLGPGYGVERVGSVTSKCRWQLAGLVTTS